MENILTGIKNFLEIINNNWTTIVVIIGLVLGIIKKVQNFMKKSDEEKINIAKAQIKETMLQNITMAEMTYEDVKESGKIKRSELISHIYEDYPILSKVVDQDELIKWIDSEIDNALPILRDVIENNKFDN